MKIFLVSLMLTIYSYAMDYPTLQKKVVEESTKGWCSEDQALFMMEHIQSTKPQVCVEVGTFKGSYLLPIVATLGHLKSGMAYAINAWSNEEALRGVTPKDVNYSWWKSIDMQYAKNCCETMLKNWSLTPYCTVIPKPPRDAVKELPEIDFLHLLGGLSEEECLRNAELYLPRVKPGGYILLSQVFLYIDQTLSKMKALWLLLDECEIVCERDNSNLILFRKNP